jgi:prepilin peptidase dependent protein B
MLTTSPSSRKRRSTPTRRSIAGLSLIEMLVGITISLFILAVAAGTFVTNISNTRKLLLEARVNQELRTAMDVIARDLRRGAYWGNSLNGTLPIGTTLATQANPYSAVAATGTTQINYAYTRDATENDALDASAEQFGIKLDTTTHALQMLIGGSWQALTNSDVVTIADDGFTITPTETAIDIRRSCATTCSATTCPRVMVRTYDVSLTGVSKSDAGVSRTLQTQVRVRNDAVAGICPG